MPINYQYPLSAALYKILSSGSAEYSQWLHEKGYLSPKGKPTKLFVFSKLFIPQKDRKPEKNILKIFNHTKCQLFISSPMLEDFIQNFVVGLFSAQIIEIGNNITVDKNFQTIDCSKLQIFPGGIDPHVHLHLPTPSGFSADDFENGIKNDWFAINGEWRMINGHLQGISGQPSQIGVGNSSWSNYTIEARVGGFRNTVASAQQFLSTNPNIIFIGVRQNDSASTGYWFGIAHSHQTCSLDKDFQEVITFHSEQNYIGEDEHTIVIEVINDLFKLFIDGEAICSFTDTTVGQGIVVISTFPGTGEEPSYPWVDSITVSEK